MICNCTIRLSSIRNKRKVNNKFSYQTKVKSVMCYVRWVNRYRPWSPVLPFILNGKKSITRIYEKRTLQI